LDRSWGYGSERGLRKDNDDAFGVFQFADYTLGVVCNGVGGISGARHAATLAVRAVYDTLTGPTPADTTETLREAVNRANSIIFDESRRNHRLTGMGTTAVAAAITDDAVYVAHVGDSRAYLIRDGSVQQLTSDHTMVNLFVETGLLSPDEAQTHPEAHVLSRTVGIERSVEVDVGGPFPIQENDVVLLCSDGVHAILTDWELGNIEWDMPQQAVQQILEMVQEREGGDPATLIAFTMATCDENIALTPPPSALPEASKTLTPADRIPVGMTPAPPPAPPAPTTAPWQYTDEEAPAGSPGPTTAPPSPPPAPLGAPPPAPLGAPPPAPLGAPPPPPTAQPSQRIDDIPPPPPLNDILGRGVSEPSAYGTAPPPPVQSMPPLPPPPTGPASAPSQVPSLRKPPSKGLSLKSFGPAIGVGLAMAVLVLTVVTKFGSGGASKATAGGQATAPGEPAQPIAIETTARIALQAPATNAPSPAPSEPDNLAFFAPYVPEPPKRLHHQPQIYLQPSPGGPHQWEAVQAARNKDCNTALEATVKAMSDSSDHASLYAQVWHCFNEHHQATLLGTKIDQVSEFATMLPDLQGPEKQSETVPSWYLPSEGGLEKRLEMWRDSNQSDLFREVVSDLLGAPSVADDLAADLLIEAQAAVMLSRSARLIGIHLENEEQHSRLVNWWARRVYVLSSSLNGPAGQVIRTHRPEIIPQLQNQLDEAAWRPQSPNEPVAIMPPIAVSEAFAVGIGALAAPTALIPPEEEKPAPVRRAQPKPKPEPDVTAPFIIHRLEKAPRPLPGAPG
jgi:PPM family protein phosphatase